MMARYDGATLEVINWEKYNPRKDLKATQWFRFQNSLFEDPNFIDFSATEIVALIYILSLASKRQSGSIKISMAHVERIGRIKEKDFSSAIEKLLSLQFVQITSEVEHADVTTTSHARDVHVPLRDETRRNETERDETDAQGSVVGTQTRAVLNPEGPSAGALTWRGYKTAYQEKYGEAPPWNGKIAGQLKAFISRVPAAEAPDIARFYLSHTDRYYVQSMHPVGLLLRDAEKLRTEWVTGQRMTSAKARNSESADYAQHQLKRIQEGSL